MEPMTDFEMEYMYTADYNNNEDEGLDWDEL